MAYRKLLFSSYILLCWICLIVGYCRAQKTSEPESLIIPGEWELVKDGWPQEDFLDKVNGNKTQFYYIKDKKVSTLNWKIKRSYIQKYKETSQLYKLTFKTWIHSSDLLVIVYSRDKDPLHKKYFPYYQNEWMPSEYIFSYEELSSFLISITIGDEDVILAFKDFKIEYESQPDKLRTLNTSSNKYPDDVKKPNIFTKMGWNKIPDHTEEYLYFSIKCHEGCIIDRSQIKISNSNGKTIKSVEIEFDYWVYGENIVIETSLNKPEAKNQSIGWLKHKIINSAEQFEKFYIKIKIQDQKEHSFVAIRNFTVKVNYKESVNPEEFNCINEGECNLDRKNTLKWLKPNENLLNGIDYFYPTSEKNYLSMYRDDEDIDKRDICFNMTYWTAIDKDIRIDILYKIHIDQKDEAILSIRPKTNSFEAKYFCLKDLIALNSKNYYISVKVTQITYINGLMDFVLSINADKPNEDWYFDTQNYLHKMASNLDDETVDWKKEWIQFSPIAERTFKFNDDFVVFSADTNSKIPASAHLISKWIKNDVKLNLIEQLYSIEVTDAKLFNSFKLSPKVCDWLSHCTDVKQKLIPVEQNEQIKNYSFQFNEIKNSKFIKLLFYVEYFQGPNFNTNEIVEFKLRLNHFGDPCSKSECQHRGTCLKYPKLSEPNTPICQCDVGFTGELCQTKSNCAQLNKYNKSGQTICREYSQVVPHCEHLKDTFRCNCDKMDDGRIIWNGSSCVQPEMQKKFWYIDEIGALYTNATGNKLSYQFKNLNVTKFDICLSMDVLIKGNVNLTINYEYKNSITNTLLSIGFSALDENISFCLKDFRYTLHDEFNIALLISGVNSNEMEKIPFQLINFSASLKVRSIKPVDFMENWDSINLSNQTLYPLKIGKWRGLPESAFKDWDQNSEKYFIEFSANSSSKPFSSAMLMSDWILNNRDFSKTESYFSINYTTNSNIKYSKLSYKIIFEDNGRLVSKPSNEVKLDVTDYLISSLDKMTSPFKIVFDISYLLSEPKINDTGIEIKFYGISIGDPCYNRKGKVCKDGECNAIRPGDYSCNCKNQFGGNCDPSDICNQPNKVDKNLTNYQFCSGMPSLPDRNKNRCFANKDEFECECPEKDFFWDSRKDVKRCVRNYFDKSSIECYGENNCEFIDSIEKESKWSGRSLPKSPMNGQKFLFYFATKTGSPFKIEINNLDNKHDACFGMKYFMTEESKLGLGYNDFKTIDINSPSVNNKVDWFPSNLDEYEEICARTLSLKTEKKFNLTFIAKIDNERNSVALRFKDINKNQNNEKIIDFREIDENLTNQISYLTLWPILDNDKSYELGNQWPFALPKKVWSIDNSFISFKAKVNSAQQTAYLISNWLPKHDKEYQLKFDFYSENYTNFILHLIKFDDKMQQTIIEKNTIGDKKLNDKAVNNVNQSIRINFDKSDTPFRIAFRVDYRLVNEDDEANFQIFDLDLGDPCIDNDGYFRNCSSHGICTRKGPIDNYYCNCTEGYIDENCEHEDYCNFKKNIRVNGDNKWTTGHEVCMDGKFGECSNKNSNDFECECNSWQFWNSLEHTCQPTPKCLTKKCDLSKENCEEPNDPKKDAICKCKTIEEGFITINEGNSSKCERFNPCDKVHRNASGQDNYAEDACGDISFCIPNGESFEEYECICPKNYRTIGTGKDTICEALFCSFPSLNTCQQKCSLDPNEKRKYKCGCTDFYKEDGDKCIEITQKCNCTNGDSYCVSDPNDCTCKDGYHKVTLPNGKIGCDPNLDDVFDYICPNGKVTNTTDNKLECKCDPNFSLNETTKLCQLKKVCGRGGQGRNDCEGRNALCITDEANYGDYKCMCSTGRYPENSTYLDDIREANTKCVDVCSHGDITKTCASFNAECNPSKILKNVAKLGKIKGLPPADYCVCKAGYVWSKDKSKGCVLAIYTAEFNLTIKNTFPNLKNYKIKSSSSSSFLIRKKRAVKQDSRINADLLGFYDEIKSQNEENLKVFHNSLNYSEFDLFSIFIVNELKTIFKNAKYIPNDENDRIKIGKCELNGEFYNCQFSIIMDESSKRDQNFGIYLVEQCQNLTDIKNVCFFPTSLSKKSYLGADIEFPLLIRRDLTEKSTFLKFNPCRSDSTNGCSDYASCKFNESQISTLHSCECNRDYFHVTEQKFMPTEDGSQDKRARAETCKVRSDLCETKCLSQSPHTKCIEVAPYQDKDGNYKAEPFCSCVDTFVLSNKTKQCTSVCENRNCNQGTCVAKGENGFACQCKEGWNGENCDNEFKTGMGGWIAGIVILAVLVVIASGVALIFARRARNNDYGSNNSTHQMDDYTGTSYRVGQSGPARGQPTYQGRDNQAFHRD